MTYITDLVRTIKHGDSTEKTLIVRKKTGKFNIDAQEVRDLLASIENQAAIKGDAIKVMIRAVTTMQMFTFKHYDGELNLLNFDDYLKGHMKEDGDFEKFDYVEISVLKLN